MTTTLMTADEYIATADERGRWTQLINGEVIVNEPRLSHQRVQAEIQYALSAWCRSPEGFGEAPGQLDIKVDHHSVLVPDGVWATDLPADATHLTTPPPIIFEVRSPSTWRYDTTVKFKKYEAVGVQEAWYVDTVARVVRVYRRSSRTCASFDVALEHVDNDVLTSPLLPGFTLPVSVIFKQTPPTLS